METSDLKRKTQGLIDLPSAILPTRRRRSMPGALWFGIGAGLAALVAYFFDTRRGAARRQMAVDRTVAAAHDVQQWGTGKARHLRNKVEGTAAEMKSVSAERTGTESR